MAHVAVIGGGPAGLSAGLFCAKNGQDVTLFDTDKTWLHYAHLFNYLGASDTNGEVFLEDARDQADKHSVDRHQGEEVTEVVESSDGFVVNTDAGSYDADYVVFATGSKRGLPEELGCETTDEGTIAVDLDMETSVEDAYACGATAREEKWQAVISAGDGAAAALDILTKETGEPFHDFDEPEDAD